MSCSFRSVVRGVVQEEACHDGAEQQSMHGLIVEHAYTVNAATTVSHSASCRVDQTDSRPGR